LIPAEQVVEMYKDRVREQGKSIAKMREVLQYYEGSVMIPLPELDEMEKPAVANLLAQGVDQYAVRLASRLPDLRFSPTDPKRESAVERARTARQALLAIWDQNHLPIKFSASARQYVAYGSTGFIVKHVPANPMDKRQIPHIHELNPLYTFPAPCSDRHNYEPQNVIILHRKTLAWLRMRYPDAAARIYKGPGAKPDKMFDLLEYSDDQETVLVLVGERRGEYEYGDYERGVSSCEELERYANLAKVCPAVIAGRITLDRCQGQFDQILGLYYNQAQLQALDLIGIHRTIFPQQWVISHPGAPGEARILAEADARQGHIGEVANGTILTVTPQVNQMTAVSIDRLAAEIRRGAQLPSEIGGEAGSNIRTAKRGVEVMQSAMDPNIQEAQTVYEQLFEGMDERIMATSKAHWGRKMISFYQNKRDGSNVGSGDYTPNDAFASEFHYVVFSMPGVDAAGIPIELAQRTQAGLMSKDTARRSDPMIEDPEAEADQIETETLEQALLMGLAQQAQQGGIDPHEIALIIRMRKDHPEWDVAKVVDEAHKELQAQQAENATAAPGAPEAQPGMAPSAGPPQQGQQGPPPLAQLLANLRSPAKESPAEQQLAGAGAPQQ
jgi:hypothetical protein